ncbi:hypothetical protein CLOSTASPAR_06197 [[Clostridium] asparagiforme DSM 15981]|uniref:Uncharacterized protein n=1 Tax=[Clostridium] asparagiforme DSM 15981 TaxID=518636 RepID=C0DA94_9FIRM|nr:hypothetical protein CLOSTASPAR_06197 [[Clostridium] asparagiforme DSM 15981]
METDQVRAAALIINYTKKKHKNKRKIYFYICFRYEIKNIFVFYVDFA